MADSPFNMSKTAAAAAPAAATATKDDDPAAAAVTNLGDAEPIGGKNDPYLAADPAGLSSVKITDYVGELMLLHPTGVGEMVTAVSAETGKPSEYVQADIILLTGEAEGERFDGVIVWQVALRRELSAALSNGTSWLLARLVLGAKKPGKHAPYILQAASDEDKVIYAAWREAQRKK